MIKYCGSFVFKFVGGDGISRTCYYCKRNKKSGMVCVYDNTSNDYDTIFVCPVCVLRGCRKSEEAWEKIFRNRK